MSIPIRNVYFLLLYAWGHFKIGTVKDVGTDESPDLPNLLGKVLNDGAHRLLRRGPDRGYIDVTEETRSPRGKLRLDIMTKQQTMLRGLAVCDTDELTADVLHNKILKATLVSLANCEDVHKSLRHELSISARRLAAVSPIRLSADIFHRIQLSRNTSTYGFLMRVCELVFHSQLPDARGTGSKFRNILDDETRMPALFEDFLRNFYRTELVGYTAASEIMPWYAEAKDEVDLTYLPVMKTDITLRTKNQTIIADAKYYKDALKGGRYGAKIHSTHLYQISTYIEHARRNEPDKKIAGLVIYPSNGQSVRLKYRLLGNPVTVATINLAAEWRDIHAQLLEMVGFAAEQD